MKIVILDGYSVNPGDLSWDELKTFGELTVYDRTPADKIEERAAGAEILLTNKTPLSKEIFGRLPKLKYVGVLATGYNIVDTGAAKEHGVIVTNVPAYSTEAVAQFTFALLLELCHHVGEHNAAVKRGEWSHCADFSFWTHPLIELAGKTMGIIGFGRIGRAVAGIAQAMGMKVMAYSRHRDVSAENDRLRFAEFDELLAESDVISLHCPLFDSTRGMIDKNAIEKMKDGVFIINTARGPLIVEEDLAQALNSGKVAGAAVDVVSKEPITEDNPLLKARNCIITPHIAWAPKEARKRLIKTTVENLAAYISGKPVNVVNG